MTLKDIAGAPLWAPRSWFPHSVPVAEGIYGCGAGKYLITSGSEGRDEVRAVGWAASDYWAERVWSSPPFKGDLSVPPPASPEVPSLVEFGKPETLSFENFRRSEEALPGARTRVSMLNATYRMTDGKFLYCSIDAVGGISAHFGSPRPKKSELPVAITIKLHTLAPASG